MVSVIVPVYNGKEKVYQCLTSIFDTAYKDFEVIVVDDNSPESGAIEDVIKGFPCKYIRLLENQGAAVARNEGAKNSKGDVLLFTDSDCIVPKDWVKDCQVELLAQNKRDPKVAAIAGRLESHRSMIEMSQMYSLYAFVINGPERSMDFFNTS